MEDKPKNKLKKFSFKFNSKNLFIILFIALFLFFTFRSVSDELKKALPEKSLTQTIQDIKKGDIKSIDIVDNKVILMYKNDSLGVTFKEAEQSFTKTLQDNNIDVSKLEINIKDTQASAGLIAFFANVIPTLLLVAFFIYPNVPVK